jgi:predicted HD phosphohydrolase
MRSRLLLSGGLVLAAVCGTLYTTARTTVPLDYTAGAWLLVAVTLVGVFDVWLPRGDYSDMGGALVFAAGLLLHPVLAAAVVVVSRLLVWAARRSREENWQVLEDLARRVAQMTVSLSAFWLSGGFTPITTGHGAGLSLRILFAAAVFFVLDIVAAQLVSSLRLSSPFFPLLLGNIKLQGWMATAQVSAAVLAVITYPGMQGLGIAIVVGLLLVMRQSFSLLVEVRHAYRSTIEALARAIEAHDPRRRGHAERVAALATETGRLLGRHGGDLEALTYAALFHDVGRLEAESGGAKSSADVLGNVGFLSSSIPVLAIIDERGEIETSQQEAHLVAAYVVARMSAFDDMNHGCFSMSEQGAADAIGARLYSATRREADRAIRRVELHYAAGGLPQETVTAGAGTTW